MIAHKPSLAFFVGVKFDVCFFSFKGGVSFKNNPLLLECEHTLAHSDCTYPVGEVMQINESNGTFVQRWWQKILAKLRGKVGRWTSVVWVEVAQFRWLWRLLT